jgi:RHS repeat-associated protein
MTDRDASNSGYNWTAVYDAFNRRLSTATILVTNNIAFNSLPKTINQYYDPSFRFMELGVSYGTTTEFKLYGPDLDGKYGGLNGVGGFDGVSSGLNLFNPTISDHRGNILGSITNGVVAWNPARLTGYGAVPGYRPLVLGQGANLAQASAYRGRWMDITLSYNIGLRPYLPASGSWLSHDSIWSGRDPNGFTYCGDDPVDGDDPDGKCVENTPPSLNFGYAPEMATSLQTTTYFKNGHIGTGNQIYDPKQVAGNSYKFVTAPTGRYFSYVSPYSLPADYGQTTITPVTTWQVKAQQNKQYLEATAFVLATVLSDGAAVEDEALVGRMLPELEFSASKYPQLSENILNAQRAGHPEILTHGGDIVANRAAALEGVPNIRPLSRDEYPFASSMEGGSGAWVGHVPISQQNAQGAIMKNFFKQNNIQAGSQYRVVVKP